MRITIEYGRGNEMTKEFPAGTTLGQAIKNQAVQAGLGYGANVEGRIGGVVQSASLVLQDGMRVVVHDKACEKQRS